MASRRGMSNGDRFAVDMACVTATGAVVNVPCYVYSIIARIEDSTTSGLGLVGNTTAVADLVKESTKISFKIGNAAATANSTPIDQMRFIPPLYCQNGLYFAASTGITAISVAYFPAS